MTLQDFLTDDQINAMIKIWKDDRSTFHRRVLAEVIEPNMREINCKLGQENDAGYLAYACEYVCMAATREGEK